MNTPAVTNPDNVTIFASVAAAAVMVILITASVCLRLACIRKRKISQSQIHYDITETDTRYRCEL